MLLPPSCANSSFRRQRYPISEDEPNPHNEPLTFTIVSDYHHSPHQISSTIPALVLMTHNFINGACSHRRTRSRSESPRHTSLHLESETSFHQPTAPARHLTPRVDFHLHKRVNDHIVAANRGKRLCSLVETIKHETSTDTDVDRSGLRQEPANKLCASYSRLPAHIGTDDQSR